jgi:hypothetical protein
MESTHPVWPTIYEAPTRLERLEDVRDYIQAIDFGPQKALMAEVEHGGVGWIAPKLDLMEEYYRNWLFLRRKYESRILPPTSQLDVFWHYHMLDTRAYIRDTQVIFGYYLHHFPYFGMRDDRDKHELQVAFAEMEDLYRREYGEEIYEWDDDAPWPPKS